MLVGASYFRVLGQGQVYWPVRAAWHIDTALPSGRSSRVFRESGLGALKPPTNVCLCAAGPRAGNRRSLLCLSCRDDTVVDDAVQKFTLRDKVANWAWRTDQHVPVQFSLSGA